LAQNANHLKMCNIVHFEPSTLPMSSINVNKPQAVPDCPKMKPQGNSPWSWNWDLICHQWEERPPAQKNWQNHSLVRRAALPQMLYTDAISSTHTWTINPWSEHLFS
jgi:hypothetical protein